MKRYKMLKLSRAATNNCFYYQLIIYYFNDFFNEFSLGNVRK